MSQKGPPVLWEDIRSLARALMAHPARRRRVLCRVILNGATRAARQAVATGRVHPRWGNGSIDAAARRFPLAAEPFPGDADYAACLQMALGAACQASSSQTSAGTSLKCKTPRRRLAAGAFRVIR